MIPKTTIFILNDLCLKLTADKAGILQNFLFLLLFTSEIGKRVDDDTKDEVENNNDDDEEEQ